MSSIGLPAALTLHTAVEKSADGSRRTSPGRAITNYGAPTPRRARVARGHRHSYGRFAATAQYVDLDDLDEIARLAGMSP
jgi:hypothetical protein